MGPYKMSNFLWCKDTEKTHHMWQYKHLTRTRKDQQYFFFPWEVCKFNSSLGYDALYRASQNFGYCHFLGQFFLPWNAIYQPRKTLQIYLRLSDLKIGRACWIFWLGKYNHMWYLLDLHSVYWSFSYCLYILVVLMSHHLEIAYCLK